MRTLNFFSLMLSNFKGYIVLHVLSLIGFIGCIVYLPVLISQVITNLFQLGTILVILLIVNVFISFFIRIYHYYVWIKFLPLLQAKLSADILNMMIIKTYSFFQTNLSGDLSKKRTDLVTEVANVYMAVIEGFIFSFIVIAASVLSLHSLALKYSFIVILWCAFFILLSLFYAKKLSMLSMKSAKSDTHLNGLSTDVISNFLSVKLFHREQFEEERFNKMNQENTKLKMDLEKVYYIIYTSYSLAFLLMFSVGCWFLWSDYYNDAIDPAGMVLFLQMCLGLVGRLWILTEQMQKYITGMGKIQEAIKVIFPTQHQSLETAKEYPSFNVEKGELEFKDIHFKYSGKSELFEALNVTIKSNEKVGLVGYSGAGKTTFINLLLKLYPVNKGTILIDGKDINSISDSDLYRSISIISQDSVLFHRSVFENIAYGKIDATKEEVIEAAKMAQAHDFITELEHGYETDVGERGSKLSGGQRQRIMIARALLKNSKIILMDEVTSQLDSDNEFKIQKNLMEVMKHKTAIVIAHRLSTLQIMDRLLVFEKGKIIEDGSHAELLAKNGTYAQLWKQQIGG